MSIIDLTMPLTEADKNASVKTESWELSFNGNIPYTGVVHELTYSSMAGTYIDFPGHVKESDDGMRALNYPIEKLFRVKTAVIHLDRESGSGGVSADELKKACNGIDKDYGALVINALGNKRFDEIEERSVFLDNSSVDWINSLGIHLLVSDIYESQGKHGVFYYLFQKGVSTICCPVNLHKLTTPITMLSCFFTPHENVMQITCRLIAEI